jgi:hypothetical protein
MNDQIKQFAEQAGLKLPVDTEYNGHIYRHALEKFAQLIVRECADIADIERPNSTGCGYITKTKGMLIREHFGVEL